jgi:hypothetical protein
LGVNTGGTGLEYKSIAAGSGITVTPAAGTITISATGGGSGTVTSVATGTGLTGGPITGSGSISIANGGVTTTEILDGTIAAADFASTVGVWTLASSNVYRTTESVGIGTSTPRAKLDVYSGAIVSAPAGANTGTSGGTVDFSVSNMEYTDAACGAFTLTGMKNGGSYMLAVQGSGGTCSFVHSGFTVHLPPNHGAATPAKHTIYNFAVLGTHIYIAWTPGY